MSRWVPYDHPGRAQPLPRDSLLKLTRDLKPKQRRHAHTPQEWDALREVILRLYIEEDKTADELVDILKSQYGFVVGKRKLREWIKDQGITKNEKKPNMQILYAKRHGRLLTQGKRTVIFKDGRVLDDDKLNRWGTKYADSFDVTKYLAAATPEGYTITTPGATNLHGESHTWEHKSLKDLFIAEKVVQTAFGAVLDTLDDREPNSHPHPHQIGIFGLRMTSETSDDKVPELLRQSLILARNLISIMLDPNPHGNEYYVSARPTPDTRVPKVSISYTGCSQSDMKPILESRIVTILKNSKTCVQLLQLSPGDCHKWQHDWYAMTWEEKSVVDSLCTTFFGSLSSFDPVIAYMHVAILLESPNGPTDTVLTRISLGIDTRLVPECMRCQRRVVSVNSMNEKGALQLNVPLQLAWQDSWEPEEIQVVEASEIARWDDHVYALRGWFVTMEPYSHFPWGYNNHYTEEGETWDPMDANNPLAVFQPRETAKPIGFCACNHVDFVCQCCIEDEGSYEFNPADSEEVCWDPDDSVPTILTMALKDCSGEEVIEFPSQY